jgi:hypothetical protein
MRSGTTGDALAQCSASCLDADDAPAFAALGRTLAGMSEQDQAEVLRFAQYLLMTSPSRGTADVVAYTAPGGPHRRGASPP